MARGRVVNMYLSTGNELVLESTETKSTVLVLKNFAKVLEISSTFQVHSSTLTKNIGIVTKHIVKVDTFMNITNFIKLRTIPIYELSVK